MSAMAANESVMRAVKETPFFCFASPDSSYSTFSSTMMLYVDRCAECAGTYWFAFVGSSKR